ncbi:MAG TPA: phospholipase D-like domain-containing protein [Polyangiales bacterium]|nr:phospholipase D-like domain-containing protein [Polyangiales bacterium]
MWLVPHIFSILGFLLAVVLLSRIVREHRPPASTMAWLLSILLVPYLGVPLYLLIGGRKHRRLAARKETLYTLPLGHEVVAAHAIERILLAGGVPRTSSGDRLELLASGEEAFARIITLFRDAQRSIDVSTFILGGDAAGQLVLGTLAERAAAGVEVRLLLDGLFYFRPRRDHLLKFTRAGGRLAVFMPLLRLPLRGPANLRNHRKIIVVDGERAVMGGMNLADEYMGPEVRADRWTDVALLLEGPAVTHIHNVFHSDWAFASHERVLPPTEAMPALLAQAQSVGDTSDAAVLANHGRSHALANARVQVVASGPDVPGDTYYDAILTALFQARERIWIATPYFIPDEAISRGLVLAARRGVDVRLAVPERSNHLSADIAGGSYLRQIEQAGGRVRPFHRGMMHAKVTLIDHELAIVGSANLDIRSLFLDYEIALFIYTRPEIEVFEAWFQALLRDCGERLAAPGTVRALAEDLGRLLAPLM